MKRTYVASMGDAGNPLTWSGIPFHLTEAGRAAGFVAAGLPLRTTGWGWTGRRIAWNAVQIVRGDRRGGYQYSPRFLERLWRPLRNELAGATVINCFQLYPRSIIADDSIDKWFFVDLTLTQLLDYYLVRPLVGRRVMAQAIAREREGYERAGGVIVMSRFAAESVRADYGIAAERVHVVVPGANLDPGHYARWEQGRRVQPARAGDELRLVMVTTEWKRKGLDRLLRALDLARRQGLRATLRVIGAQREDVPYSLPVDDKVEWLGRINKSTDAARFLEAVADADVGCILSRNEAGGSVLREYHALGLAAFATRAGGMPDFMFADASVTVSSDASDEQIADALLTLFRDKERLASLRANAWRCRHEALWPASVARLREIVDPAG